MAGINSGSDGSSGTGQAAQNVAFMQTSGQSAFNYAGFPAPLTQHQPFGSVYQPQHEHVPQQFHHFTRRHRLRSHRLTCRQMNMQTPQHHGWMQQQQMQQQGYTQANQHAIPTHHQFQPSSQNGCSWVRYQGGTFLVPVLVPDLQNI